MIVERIIDPAAMDGNLGGLPRRQNGGDGDVGGAEELSGPGVPSRSAPEHAALIYGTQRIEQPPEGKRRTLNVDMLGDACVDQVSTNPERTKKRPSQRADKGRNVEGLWQRPKDLHSIAEDRACGEPAKSSERIQPGAGRLKVDH